MAYTREELRAALIAADKAGDAAAATRIAERIQALKEEGRGETPKELVPPVPYEPGKIDFTKEGREAGRKMGVGQGLMTGAQRGVYRAARGVGIPQTLAALGLTDDAESVDKLLGGAADTAPGGTTGDVIGTGLTIGGTGAMGLRGAAAGSPVLARTMAAHPYATGALAAGVPTAAFTPGGPGERLIEGGKAAALSTPFTWLGRTAAQPLKMSEAGEDFLARTGEIPPVSMGAESKIIRAGAAQGRLVPGVNQLIKSGEQRVARAGVVDAWEKATPPGKPNIAKELAKGGEGVGPEAFQTLQTQFDEAYKAALTGQKVPFGAAERAALRKAADMDPSGKVHQALGVLNDLNMLQARGGHITASQWHNVRNNLKLERAKFAAKEDAASQRIVKAYDKAISGLDAPAKANKGFYERVTAIDDALENRKTLEVAGAKVPSSETLQPKDIAGAIRSRADAGEVARRGAPLQDVIDPLVQMESEAVGRGWSGTQRGMGQIASLATPFLPGGHFLTMGQTALALPGIVGATRPGASIMFGKTRAQQALQRLMDDPEAYRAAVSAAGGAGAGINPE